MPDSSGYKRLQEEEVEVDQDVYDDNDDSTTSTRKPRTVLNSGSEPRYEAVPITSDPDVDPPSIQAVGENVHVVESVNDMDAPPPVYSKSAEGVVSPSEIEKNLPTYEDYEKDHENDDDFDTNLPEPYTMPIEYSLREGGPTITVYDGFDLAIGDDSTFVATMFIAFFLNWLGFLLAYVFSRTIAGKCGATSGFGLCLIKLVMVVKASAEESVSTHGGKSDAQYTSWFMWVIVFFGWFTFVRGITIYVKYKREFAALRSEISAI
eukprot:CFRG8084T1